MGSDRLRIGSGSSWWGDRIEPAALNAEAGDLDYLCFETMAEATVSAAQVRKRRDPTFPGYDTYLDDRMRKVLPGCMRRGTRIVSNQGWINPRGAALRVAELLRELGHKGVRIVYGQPFHVPREFDGQKVSATEATEIIMLEIARLLPEDYRGVYTDRLKNQSVRKIIPYDFKSSSSSGSSAPSDSSSLNSSSTSGP